MILRIIFLQSSRFLCGMNSVSMELFQFTSTWLVVALTWTRVIAVMFPFGARGCQNCSAVITITTLICISFIISLTKLYSGGKVYPVFKFPLLPPSSAKFAIQLRYIVIHVYTLHIITLPDNGISRTMLIIGFETDSVFEFVPCQEKIKPWGGAMYFYIALSTWLPLLFISIGNLLLIIRMRKSYKIHNALTRKFDY